jgi:hypothetical protein
MQSSLSKGLEIYCDASLPVCGLGFLKGSLSILAGPGTPTLDLCWRDHRSGSPIIHGPPQKDLSAQTPPSFQVPIPSTGPYRDALTSVAWFYERNSLGARLNVRGNFADEMFIFTADLEEFEVVLVDMDSSQSIRARGRMVFEA